MPADSLYEALHPFHQWAQIAEVCAFVLAVGAFAVLGISRRLSRRWWVGLGVLALCLLAVVFGARSRGASYDLRPIAQNCFDQPSVSGCEVWGLWLTDAQQRVAVLGIVLLIGTALGVAATVVVVLAWRRSGAEWRHIPARIWLLPFALLAAGYGAFQTANSVARWIETAYLADITRAGDGLGQIPLIEAIMGAIFGSVVLVIGLALVIFCSRPRRERPATQ
jgi:hypothetical protein